MNINGDSPEQTGMHGSFLYKKQKFAGEDIAFASKESGCP